MSRKNPTPIASPRTAPVRVSSIGSTKAAPASRKPNVKINVQNVHSPPPTPSPTSVSPKNTLFPGSPPERASSRLSTGSSVSSGSTDSARSSVAPVDLKARRRGFMKPKETEFANSARQRESVMCLGSIAHLQYFFAKTGLLDGKGGTLAKKGSKSGSSSPNGPMATSPFLTTEFAGLHFGDSTYSSLRSSPEPMILSPLEPHDGFFSQSPVDDYLSDDDIDDPMMKLPPTTSTYNHKSIVLPPTPDPELLRGQLREALALTKQTWEACPLLDAPDTEDAQERRKSLPKTVLSLQGDELIDLATSAIRAAKAYYYTTDVTQLKANAKRSDKEIRQDFLTVLDSLKKMSSNREFDGRVTMAEKESVVSWITSVEELLSSEETEIAEMRLKSREWAEGDWSGREMERNHAFLSYFDPSPTPLPAPPRAGLTGPDEPIEPNPFLESLQTGLRLILIHNSIIRRSKRPFGRIPRYHSEFSVPYRAAENLRYWRKAAEIRWETRLTGVKDVLEVAAGSEAGLRGLEEDVNAWCEKVLAEVRREWGDSAA